MEAVLLLSGVVAVAMGTWRGYVNARAVMAPLVHPGDPTRTAIEATQPLAERSRVRRMARNVAAAVAWLVVAMYGLFLIASAEASR